MSVLAQWANGIDLQWLIEEAFVIIAAIFAITVHESAHGLAAYWLGDDTAKRMGRISLNPLRHIDPFGLLMLAIVKFGWAKPVPINMRRFKNPKTGMALSALAGPAANVLLALLATILYHICARAVFASGGEVWYYLALLFLYMQLINAGLAVFNLIPIPPLDGSKIFAIILPEKAHTALMKYERYGFAVLMVLLFSGILDTPLNYLRGGLINGLNSLVESLFRIL